MFATAEDMKARYGEDELVQLTDQDGWNAQAIAAINVKLQTASSIAEGYVAKYYAPAPGRALPPLLTELVCEIAYAKLHKAPPEAIEKRETRALDQLKDISRGLIKIDQGKQDIPSRTGAVIVPDRQRTFSRDSLGEF
ncbi:DUF1320 family protein [Sphingobium sp. WTD-1]|uniref:phage protein Gp36 family protein n=1 Tax=Sphingobium sp. WTD-1 TaxID=2979467 RepID=UPI0024DE935C|nr:phage protein Gp36 family protein [Sphingobium sp. WTD-1]WIA55479.1 DUF1320 family protein [Sphingobium sp. WTD-1]